MHVRLPCTLLTVTGVVGVAPVLSLRDAICGGVHCYDVLAYCCSDERGKESCCFKSLYEQYWFWLVLGIGLLLMGVSVYFSCRAMYRYRNAGQYTKLRRQQGNVYGSIVPGGQPSYMLPPPPPIDAENHDVVVGQLPSYASVMNPPPPYDERDAQTSESHTAAQCAT